MRLSDFIAFFLPTNAKNTRILHAKNEKAEAERIENEQKEARAMQQSH